MNILGISGLHNSTAFKRRMFPSLTDREYRIATGHDSAAAMVTQDGLVAAAAEERFSRQKGTGSFPVHAIHFCLQQSGLTWEDIDYVAHGFAYEPLREFFLSLSAFEKQRFEEVYSHTAQIRAIREFFPESVSDKLRAVPHHMAHAASTFYLSGMEESLIVVSDGMGETHSVTVAIGNSQGIEVINAIASLHSLGMLYSVVTLHLGFAMSSDEYKVMGLAPYGNARKTMPHFMELIRLNPDGTYSIPCLAESGTDAEQETLSQSRRYIESVFGPPRDPGSELTRHHMDIAAGLQSALQHAFLHLLRHHKNETGMSNLCLAGGVALNCAMNGVIARSRLFKNTFVQPAAGDDGTSAGAALYLQRTHQPETRHARMQPPFLGPEFSDQEIESMLSRDTQCRYMKHEAREDLLERTAKALEQGKIIGWFQGRMEFGPRALGARSIVANPGIADMRDRVNSLIKKREDFRPFAPAVLRERAHEYFHLDPGTEDMYENMLFVTKVRSQHRERLPAVTHVDGSARVQVVSNSNNPMFHSLIRTFDEVSDMPILLNTSFNVMGQPIVCTPQEALDTFLAANLDYLVIGSFWVERACQQSD